MGLTMTRLARLRELAAGATAGDCSAMLRALAKNDLVKNAPLAVFTLLKAAAELDERNAVVLAMIECIEAADAMRNLLGLEWYTNVRKDYDAAIARLEQEP